ncbi:tetraspanin-2A [Cryptotermes secundus]|uniref:tetraspanin-2A n=1 Tax=Cryptotermes secundus TaxID=105785 RepID=UPI000CD7CEBE|nr:tetraspanin-2A [Cryptotermes secundus]
MAGGKGDGAGSGYGDLNSKITCLKGTLFCFNVATWLLGASIFGLALWMSLESGVGEWMEKLELSEYYTGIYVLIAAGVILIIVSFLGCVSAFMEDRTILVIFVGVQVICFILGAAGAAVLLDYSTYDSQIQPLIRQRMRYLISESQNEYASSVLRMVQETIGCCGADGPNDYLQLLKPLPTECRDTVTGNAFFYGCVDELTWFLEDKSGWLSALALTACFVHVINIVLSAVLSEALKRENEDRGFVYKR